MNRTLTIDLAAALLIRQNFLPLNPDDFRGIDQKTRKAVKDFIAEIDRALTQPLMDAVDKDVQNLMQTLTKQ